MADEHSGNPVDFDAARMRGARWWRRRWMPVAIYPDGRFPMPQLRCWRWRDCEGICAAMRMHANTAWYSGVLAERADQEAAIEERERSGEFSTDEPA